MIVYRIYNLWIQRGDFLFTLIQPWPWFCQLAYHLAYHLPSVLFRPKPNDKTSSSTFPSDTTYASKLPLQHSVHHTHCVLRFFNWFNTNVITGPISNSYLLRDAVNHMSVYFSICPAKSKFKELWPVTCSCYSSWNTGSATKSPVLSMSCRIPSSTSWTYIQLKESGLFPVLVQIMGPKGQFLCPKNYVTTSLEWIFIVGWGLFWPPYPGTQNGHPT